MTENDTNTKSFSNCPVKTETVLASFSFDSDWAGVGVTNPGAHVRKVAGASLRWGSEDADPYIGKEIPCVLLPVLLALYKSPY